MAKIDDEKKSVMSADSYVHFYCAPNTTFLKLKMCVLHVLLTVLSRLATPSKSIKRKYVVNHLIILKAMLYVTQKVIIFI